MSIYRSTFGSGSPYLSSYMPMARLGSSNMSIASSNSGSPGQKTLLETPVANDVLQWIQGSPAGAYYNNTEDDLLGLASWDSLYDKTIDSWGAGTLAELAAQTTTQIPFQPPCQLPIDELYSPIQSVFEDPSEPSTGVLGVSPQERYMQATLPSRPPLSPPFPTLHATRSLDTLRSIPSRDSLRSCPSRETLRSSPPHQQSRVIKHKESNKRLRHSVSRGRLSTRMSNPLYLLDNREPDNNGFVNFDSHDGRIIMAAVAPSGNCKSAKRAITKKT
jgi:hypothetical protein